MNKNLLSLFAAAALAAGSAQAKPVAPPPPAPPKAAAAAPKPAPKPSAEQGFRKALGGVGTQGTGTGPANVTAPPPAQPK